MSKILENSKVLEMIDTVKEYHSTQTRNNGKIPYSVHCTSVCEILINNLILTGEISLVENEGINVACAALGHDLLEDTSITRDLIDSKFGNNVLALIGEVTNDDGDENHDMYMKKLSSVSEEALLIKYSDLIDNTIGIAYGLHDLGVDWSNKFYIPIMKGTEQLLNSREFKKYPKTADLLKLQYQFSKERLLSNLKKFE